MSIYRYVEGFFSLTGPTLSDFFVPDLCDVVGEIVIKLFHRCLHLFSIFRYVDISICRGTLTNFSRTSAFRIVAAAPELIAGVDTFLCYPFEHRFAADGARWSVGGDALLRAMRKAFGRKAFCEATVFFEQL